MSFSFISIRVEKYMFFSCTGLIEVGVFQGVLSLSEIHDLEVKTTFQKGKHSLGIQWLGFSHVTGVLTISSTMPQGAAGIGKTFSDHLPGGKQRTGARAQVTPRIQ